MTKLLLTVLVAVVVFAFVLPWLIHWAILVLVIAGVVFIGKALIGSKVHR